MPKLKIRFTPNGARVIHDDQFTDMLKQLNFKPPTRASHVEPIVDGPNAWQWRVDFTPLGHDWQFCLWPPLPSREIALAAEHDFLQKHWVEAAPLPAELPSVELLATLFSQEMTSRLTAAELREIARLNAEETDASICHSHDFCDPNQFMIDALAKLAITDIGGNATVTGVIDKAWDLAKRCHFDPANVRVADRLRYGVQAVACRRFT